MSVKEGLCNLGGHDIEGEDCGQRKEECTGKRNKAEDLGEGGEWQKHYQPNNGERRQKQRLPRPTQVEALASSNDQHDQGSTGHAFHKPTRPELSSCRVHSEQQQTKRQVVADRTDKPKHNHKAPNELDIPPMGFGNQFRIHTVGGDGHFWEVGQEVRHQNLFGQ